MIDSLLASAFSTRLAVGDGTMVGVAVLPALDSRSLNVAAGRAEIGNIAEGPGDWPFQDVAFD
jgi:hypothetical protein